MKEKLDFDMENIEKQEIGLLNCQIDLILRSLEYYAYTYKFIYPRSGNNFSSKEESLRISLVQDTYFSICKQMKRKENLELQRFNMYNLDDFKKVS